MATYPLSDKKDDWYTTQTDGGAIIVTKGSTDLKITFDWISHQIIQEAHCKIKTNDIANYTILSGELWVYMQSYEASRGIAKTIDFYIFDDAHGTWQKFYSTTYSVAGWYLGKLTGSYLNYLNPVTTSFKVGVPALTVGNSRAASARAVEFSPEFSYSMYLTLSRQQIPTISKALSYRLLFSFSITKTLQYIVKVIKSGFPNLVLNTRDKRTVLKNKKEQITLSAENQPTLTGYSLTKKAVIFTKKEKSVIINKDNRANINRTNKSVILGHNKNGSGNIATSLKSSNVVKSNKDDRATLGTKNKDKAIL